MVEMRLQNIYCNEKVFSNAKILYEDALRRSGFQPSLNYDNGGPTQWKKRHNITWFNPPFCQTIETNISRKFLLLVDKHFPPDHQLRKIFNRNTLKVSPRCMPNIDSSIIKATTTNSSKVKLKIKGHATAGRTTHAQLKDTAWMRASYMKQR